ncbi:hypothetical protein [Enterococcus sp. LJL51]|uniref:hypothetical protein n=1 Tax=Enterococcus sp. LJL51 TaxID=3416656 RepID=UPI003CF9E1B6
MFNVDHVKISTTELNTYFQRQYPKTSENQGKYSDLFEENEIMETDQEKLDFLKTAGYPIENITMQIGSASRDKIMTRIFLILSKLDLIYLLREDI